MSRLPNSVKINGQNVEVPLTVADRLINYFSPAAGAARFQQRARMAINSGAYTSADKSRRANQRGRVRELDADSAIIPDLVSLREESQHMLRNSPIAGAAIATNVTKVVGTGLKVKSQVDRDTLNLAEAAADEWERKAEREFRLATESREIDCGRRLNFAMIQAVAFLKTLEDGDLLVNLPRFARPGSPYKLKLQMIEAARVNNKHRAADTATLCAGVKKDEHGAPEAYQVSSRHPGNYRTARPQEMTWTELKAFDGRGNPLCLHLIDPTRPDQTRGVPYLAPVVELIKQLGRYTDAEVMAAVVSGMMAVFVTTESGEPALGADTTDNPDSTAYDAYDTTGMELGYGSVIGLTPDAKISTVTPGRPNVAFDPFVTAILRQIGARLEIPFELLTKHFTSSYSAARAALEEAADYFLRRRAWLVEMLCQPVYEAVITEAIASGRLQAPGFFADPLVRKAWLGTQWTGDAFAQLDPLKEINAAAKRVELTISTLDEESRRFSGTPWEDKLPQILKERAILKANGISITTLEQVASEDPDALNEGDRP
jgi:lambda family phage portal protein